MQTYRGKWFRIAGIARRIKSLEPPPHWRFEVAGENGQYPLNDFRFTGEATEANNCPGTNPHAKGDVELVAWIACFGDVTTRENGVAVFHLLPPTSPCPWD